MYIETVPNRSFPPAILLREELSAGGATPETNAARNLSHWPRRRARRGLGGRAQGRRGAVAGPAVLRHRALARRTAPSAAAQGAPRCRRPGPFLLDLRTANQPNRPRDLVTAIIVARIIVLASELVTAKALDPATAASSLGVELALGQVSARTSRTRPSIGLLQRLAGCRSALAERHRRAARRRSTTSRRATVQGRRCPWPGAVTTGDGKKGKLVDRLNGLLCGARMDALVAIEPFEGRDTAHPDDLCPRGRSSALRFSIDDVVLVGRRGPLTRRP